MNNGNPRPSTKGVASGSAASYYVVASNSVGNATSSTLVVTAP